MMVDDDARYLKTHEWAKIHESSVFTVGLSAYAVEQLGEIVYVKLPQVGLEFQRGDTFGTIESTKTTVEISAPISGKIVEVNTNIPNNPHLLNRDAYGAGWLIKVETSDISEWDNLLDAMAYRKFLETEG